MQNVLKRKNMYLEGFQLLLIFSPSLKIILNLLICISKNVRKTPNLFRCPQIFFCRNYKVFVKHFLVPSCLFEPRTSWIWLLVKLILHCMYFSVPCLRTTTRCSFSAWSQNPMTVLRYKGRMKTFECVNLK